MKILITGSRGFIGNALRKRLLREGHDVKEFDAWTGNNLLDIKQLRMATKGVKVVYHLAAEADLNNAKKFTLPAMNVNVAGTYYLAQACSENGCLLNYISTCCVYGNQETHPTTEANAPSPTEIYAYSKLAGENCIKGYALTTGLKYNILRIATVYGPGMRSALAIKIFFDRALKNEQLHIHGNGLQTRTMTYIDDIVDGLVAVLAKDVVGETINITTEEEVMIHDIAKRIISITSSKSSMIYVNDRPGQIIKEAFDTIKAKQMLGWSAKVTLNDGLKRTYEWIKFLKQR